MTVRDFNAQRLYVDAPLAAGGRVSLTTEQANYLFNVLRLREGDEILIFNGRDGEWRTRLHREGKRGAHAEVAQCERSQEGGPDLVYLFAPLKRARLDYMVQKATEMGVARLSPVITRRTVAERVNVDRMRANVIEAAEQCGILRVPEVDQPERLEQVVERWDPSRALIFCDEGAEVASPLAALQRLSHEGGPRGPREVSASAPSLAVLVGPEGGFTDDERALVLSRPFTLAVSLGPRILRADTAAVAALALVNAVAGDWR